MRLATSVGVCVGGHASVRCQAVRKRNWLYADKMPTLVSHPLLCPRLWYNIKQRYREKMGNVAHTKSSFKEISVPREIGVKNMHCWRSFGGMQRLPKTLESKSLQNYVNSHANRQIYMTFYGVSILRLSDHIYSVLAMCLKSELMQARSHLRCGRIILQMLINTTNIHE